MDVADDQVNQMEKMTDKIFACYGDNVPFESDAHIIFPRFRSDSVRNTVMRATFFAFCLVVCSRFRIIFRKIYFD